MQAQLSRYLRDFKKLRRAHNGGGAPHKPILLLAICNLVAKGIITDKRIDISSDLVLEFKDLWAQLVNTNHIPTFSLPFFHLKSEPFWHLIPKSISMPSSISSIGVLRKFVFCAEIDQELFNVMNNRLGNEFLCNTLITSYFPGVANPSTYSNGYSIGLEIQNQILHEDKNEYGSRIDSLERTLNIDQFEEEIFVRGGVFKKVIPRIYNFQCAVSGMRLESTATAQMIDACHIIPFSKSKDDTITNGISLCPNLHRAFDRGLLKITSEYRVAISNTISESNSPFSLMQFEGRRISLPDNQHHMPSIENLLNHGATWKHLFN